MIFRRDAEAAETWGKGKIVNRRGRITISRVVLDLGNEPDVTSRVFEAKMVFLEDPRMIFADMRLHATSTPTSTPTRYHHRKYRPQNNNDCTIRIALNPFEEILKFDRGIFSAFLSSNFLV